MECPENKGEVSDELKRLAMEVWQIADVAVKRITTHQALSVLPTQRLGPKNYANILDKLYQEIRVIETMLLAFEGKPLLSLGVVFLPQHPEIGADLIVVRGSRPEKVADPDPLAENSSALISQPSLAELQAIQDSTARALACFGGLLVLEGMRLENKKTLKTLAQHQPGVAEHAARFLSSRHLDLEKRLAYLQLRIGIALAQAGGDGAEKVGALSKGIDAVTGQLTAALDTMTGGFEKPQWRKIGGRNAHP